MVLTLTLSLFWANAAAQGSYDSLKIKEPKHYFQSVIFLDSYSKPKKPIQAIDSIISDSILSNRLKSYGIRQFNFGFCVPIKTKQTFNADSSIYSNTHYLLTGHLMSFKPVFDSMKTHQLIKLGVGLRIIHNTGKKGLWFIDISPFLTKDITYKDRNGYLRFANSFIYSHNFSERFNLRVGLTKSFLWGNRNYLPYLGFRIGKLDKVNFSLQIPKNISLNIPFSNTVRFSIFSKPQGGMFTFSNKDSLLYFKPDDKFFNFTRYEILTGLRLDAAFGNNFACYMALGFSTRNTITFYSESRNAERPRAPYKYYFYEKKMPASGFLNFGLVLKLGKTKSYYGNRNMYDAIDLNNMNGVGDSNTGPGNTAIPIKESIKRSKLNLADVQDLIDTNDY